MLSLELAHGLFRLERTFNSLGKGRWWIFAVELLGRKFCLKIPPKKSARKSATRKQKVRRNTTPHNHQPDQ